LSRKASQKQTEILLRRDSIKELRARGLSEHKIAKRLGIPRPTVNADIRILKRQAALNLKFFVEKDLPHEAELLQENLNTLLRTAWDALDKDVENGKPPYAGIESILHILNLKEEILGNKIEIAGVVGEKTEESEMDIRDRLMREAYESERARNQRVF
jgi:predicted transcriptional regulator